MLHIPMPSQPLVTRAESSYVEKVAQFFIEYTCFEFNVISE